MFKAHHALTTAAITAGLLLGVSLLIESGSRGAVDVVSIAEAPLTSDEEAFIEAARIVTPPLDIDKAKTVAIARSLCSRLKANRDDQLKEPFIEAFSTRSYTVTRAEAGILAHKLRASGLCNG